ncbi:nucleotidyltransferase family protein [Pseudomonas saudiphocaensis]|uniref:nucleotidyltransferase family protein n=1 Tax=Pseudomonas saudiphocaensis TaxID=1499686 RepID=UPI00187D62A9|nr:nucleotidyltransferase family protein [Pseudomonas saudiphocaensis]MBE7927856.1 nucleotidyltransferase family protein [Pseudomonas saudiphocaensis]
MSAQELPCVIVLAAGHGRRYAESGGATHKLDALLDGVPVLQRVLDSVAASGLPFHLVRPGVTAETDGMGDSISRGVAATATAPGWLILPGDLPLIRPETLLRVARELSSSPVVQPFCSGRRGHPVGFAAQCRDALLALRGDRGAATVVGSYREAGQLRILELDDPGIVTDIDTLEDLAQAEALLQSRD